MAQLHPSQHTDRSYRQQKNMLPAAMRVVVALIIACAVLIAGFTFYPEWVRLSDMKINLAKEKAHLEELQKLASDQKDEVHLLKTDREYLEIIARDRLDLMKEGETIFRLTPGHSHS